MEFEGANGMSVEAKPTDRQGAQLSQECPRLSTTSQWEQTAARHNVFNCGRLFPLGLAAQLVSGPGQSFHTRVQVLIYFLLASHQRAAESVARLPLDSTSVRQKRRTSFVF
jgi:hypothetical protein